MRHRISKTNLADFSQRAWRLMQQHPRLSLGIGCLWLFNAAACLALGGALIAYAVLRPAEGSAVALNPPPAAASPTVVMPAAPAASPTQDCAPPRLTLGEASYRIETLKPGADGAWNVPPDTPGIAYWLEGSGTNYVFALSPTPDNLAALAEMKAGGQASVTWANCNATTYDLSAPMQAPQDMTAFIAQLDPAAPGLTVIIPLLPPNPGLLLQGGLAGEQLVSLPTPEAGASEIQAEISLLETSASPDGKTIRVGVSVLNYGSSSFKITANDVSLSPENGSPLAPLKAEPALPRQLKPGASETIYFTFPRPDSATAVFKIFTAEYDLEGY